MRSLIVGLIAMVGVCGVSSVAAAKTVRYHSQHPIPKRAGGGFCYIGVPHVHQYAPSDPRMFRKHDDDYYFVGDPTPFGYEGPKHAYYGAHPVAEEIGDDDGREYCYLDGPHYHWYEPPPQASFEFRGGAYWYVGNYDPSFYSERPRYVVINQAYRPITYARPVVDVTVAPPAFHGTIVASPVGVRGHAVVAPPAVSAGVYVNVPPPPSIHVGVGVAPAPVYRERVIVAEPPPRTVIIYEGHRHHYKHHEHGEWEHEDDD